MAPTSCEFSGVGCHMKANSDALLSAALLSADLQSLMVPLEHGKKKRKSSDKIFISAGYGTDDVRKSSEICPEAY